MKSEEDFISYKRGYLKSDFEFFHLKDRKKTEFEFHHHDFNKIIVFLSGKVTYHIEGRAYKLKPWDILLVGSNQVHKPIIDPDTPYERIVIWVNEDFIQKHNSPDCNLLACFELASRINYNLLRLTSESNNRVTNTLVQLEEACKSREFGGRVLKNALFMQFIVYLNRLSLASDKEEEQSDIDYDENISSILKYINENLEKNLSIESLASRFFMSKYYLMHKFKTQTGYSIHNYIIQKRLIKANSLIKQGVSITEASMECGFLDYSSFMRAFKKMFGQSPKDYYISLAQVRNLYNEDTHLKDSHITE